MNKKNQTDLQNDPFTKKTENKKRYVSPTLVTFGFMKKVTLGGSDLLTVDSDLGSAPGPRP